MAASQESPAVQAVLTALDALYNKPEKSVKDEANTWLQNFQKTVSGRIKLIISWSMIRADNLLCLCLQPEAWETANALLLSQDLPLESRIFAAQTFRNKVSCLGGVVLPTVILTYQTCT
jgi:transportin-3